MCNRPGLQGLSAGGIGAVLLLARRTGLIDDINNNLQHAVNRTQSASSVDDGASRAVES
jgi:hypothetical protein